jgi:phospholipid transport system transporter-binding protein
MATRRAAKSPARPKRKQAGSLALPQDCGLPQVEALKAKLKVALSRAAPVTLDATRVTGIDTAGLQLLAAFVREREAGGRKVAWQGVTESFAEAAQRLGLAAMLAATP